MRSVQYTYVDSSVACPGRGTTGNLDADNTMLYYTLSYLYIFAEPIVRLAHLSSSRRYKQPTQMEASFKVCCMSS